MWDNATVYEINHHTDPQEPYKVKFDARIIDEVKKQVSDFTKFHDFSKKNYVKSFFHRHFPKKFDRNTLLTTNLPKLDFKLEPELLVCDFTKFSRFSI